MSEGIRSGVNWMRLNVQSIESARERAKVVLPIPGIPVILGERGKSFSDITIQQA